MSPQRIDVIQTSRAVAALAVVVFHVNWSIVSVFGESQGFSPARLGERGVDFFFVLSGFIIWHVHSADIGHPSRTINYARKRFVRLYPTLWLVSGSYLLSNALLDDAEYSIDQLFTTFTLLPSVTWPEPAVVWTLRYEILFYLAFGVVILSPRLGGLLAILWGSACVARIVLESQNVLFPELARMMLSPLSLQFAMGCLAAFILSRWRPQKPLRFLGLAFGAFGVVLAVHFISGAPGRYLYLYDPGPDALWDVLFGLGFALLVFALASASATLRQPKSMILLGDASYAIYLTHTIAIGVIQRHLAGTVPTGIVESGVLHIVLTLLCIALGLLVHLLFERPLLSVVRAMMPQRDKARSGAEEKPRPASY